MTDPDDRTRILAQLAEQQAHQRQHHVTELADLHARIAQLRADLKTTEQTYRTTYRRAITTGLLTGPQLRTLGLPPIDARRRPSVGPSAPPHVDRNQPPMTKDHARQPDRSDNTRLDETPTSFESRPPTQAVRAS